MHSTSDYFRREAHAFESIWLHKLPLARLTKITLLHAHLAPA